MRKRIFQAIAIVFSAFSLAWVILGITVSNRLMYVKKKDAHLILERETSAKRYDESWFANVKKSEQWIQSDNGYGIKAIFLEPYETNRYVVICHGVSETKVNSFKYARMFEHLGFNSVVYDHRRHGDSGGKTTSFGHYEKYDLKAVLEALKKHKSGALIVGIHGESMGAATTLLYAGMQDDADFYISDSSYSSIFDQVLHVMKTTTKYKSSFPLKFAGVFLKWRDGYSIKTVAPRDAIALVQKPILFIHSLEDEFVPPEMSKELYKLKKGPKTIKLFETGAHAQSFNLYPEEYEKTIAAFLLENELLPETPSTIRPIRNEAEGKSLELDK